MAEWLSNISNVLMIVIGFGLVIVVHELGHFLAARWAGIRVHAFAVGFGPAVFSWRKGLGLRRGSSEREYRKLVDKSGGVEPTVEDAKRAATDESFAAGVLRGISSTEYRLNWFPFGGYVKMLGQDDLDPSARSGAPDAFNSKPVWKRMIVISAGVIMNLLLAAVLFMVVFAFGMRETAPVIGEVARGLPAEAAGLRSGDVVVRINDHKAESFTDLQIAAAMAKRGQPIELVVQRDGENQTIRVEPQPGGREKFLQIGVTPATSSRTWPLPKGEREREVSAEILKRLSLPGVELGSELLRVDGVALQPVTLPDGRAIPLADPLFDHIRASGGKPVVATFRGPDATERDITIVPRPQLQTAWTPLTTNRVMVEHLMGLSPVMKIAHVEALRTAARERLREGDIFARIGAQEWPDMASGIREIKASKGAEIELVLLRDGELVSVSAPVSSEGTIGFMPEPSLDVSIISAPPELYARDHGSDQPGTPAARLIPSVLPGMRVVSLAGTPVSSFGDMRTAMVAATRDALAAAAGITIELELAAPIGAAPRENERVRLSLTPEEVRSLHALGWQAPTGLDELFETASIVQVASNPVEALGIGIRKTHRSMVLTYITFARLFEGTVRVEHLKGPVGIAHVGSRFAAEGIIYLLYFLALISVNLAVINFLPIPIVDGGLFTMLAIEGITRRPVPAGVQNALTLVGLLLIGTMFVVVTFNDIVALF